MPQLLIGIVVSLAISVVLKVVLPLLFPPAQRQTPFVQQPTAPRAADGKYNLKQNVPPLSIVLGRVKKGSDYDFLEETQGTAFHILVPAGHRMHGIVQHYLHDEPVAVDGAGWITSPSHFDGKVRLSGKLGLDAQEAWSTIYGFFPSIWSVDHRGDGLAQVLMEVLTVNEEYYLKVFPQQMPAHTAVYDGALLYDPRNVGHDPDDHNTWSFSRNLALFRLHQLTQPWGGRLSIADLYLPEWIAAADVCDEQVTNRLGELEPRYHGGLWFRVNTDQVEIGRIIDQAAELVVYERPDGLIGVHAGRMVAPDVRITTDDMKEFHYDANRRKGSTVLAVRGRWTDPANVYNEVDAAIYGDPYVDDTERTKTVSNTAVQYHNHIFRLQKIAYIRANAPRVRITVDDDDEFGKILERRFVRVHRPDRGMNEGIVEITGRPKLSLQNLTITFEGIVVPSTLFAFNAATEEGIPGGQVEAVTPGGIPVPTGFAVAIGAEVLAGGQSAAFAMGSWDFVSDALSYELEFQLDDLTEPPRSVTSKPGDTEVRTLHLKDGAVYRFRLRTWSAKAASDWTAYETATASADVSAPGQPFNFNSSKAGSNVTLTWINPNSPNLYRTVLYRNNVNNFATAVQIYSAYGGIAEPRSFTDFGVPGGTKYWWIESYNASGEPSGEVGPQTQTI